MTKSISSYPEDKRIAVIERRLKNPGQGNGYLAAVQAAEKLGIRKPVDKFSKGAARARAQQKADGREFAKKLADRKKEPRRRPVHQNKMRMA